MVLSAAEIVEYYTLGVLEGTVEREQSVGRCHPHCVVVVLHNLPCIDIQVVVGISLHAVVLVDEYGLAALPAYQIQSAAIGADPYPAATVLIGIVHVVVAYAVSVAGVVAVRREAYALRRTSVRRSHNQTAAL